jgi:hypothetical protein
MDVIELSRKLSPRALRRLARRYRKQLIAGASLAAAAAATLMLAAPALADEGEIHPTPTPCATSLPLTTPCAAPVMNPATGSYTVTLPGIGTLSITVDPTTSLITTATFTLASGTTFTASAVTINEDNNKASVTVTDGTAVYTVAAKVKPSATGLVVTAKVKTPEKEDADETEKPEAPNTATPLKSSGGNGGEHHGSGGGGGD